MNVRTRLTLWHSGLLVLLVSAFTLASYHFLDRLELARVDRMLHEQAEIVGQVLGETRAQPDSTRARTMLAALHDLRARGIRVWVMASDGTTRYSTDAVQEGEGPNEERLVLGDPVPADMVQRAATATPRRPVTVHLATSDVRLVVHRGAPERSQIIVVSTSLRAVSELLRDARRAAIVAILGGLVLSLGAGDALARRSMAPITAALDQQRRFMADASHELRTPVAILRGEADVALQAQHRPPEEYREALVVVRDAATRLSRTVNDIFLLARVDASQVPVVPAPLYLGDLVTDTCRAMRSLADERQVRVHCDVRDDAAYVGDEQLLQRLVTNLLDNAIKYAAASGHVDITFGRAATGYELQVVNDGLGIPRAAQPHVFERFFRADEARTFGATSSSGGSGLGLAIARWIAQQHGATLDLVESVDTRTVFVARFPLTPVLHGVGTHGREGIPVAIA